MIEKRVIKQNQLAKSVDSSAFLHRKKTGASLNSRAARNKTNFNSTVTAVQMKTKGFKMPKGMPNKMQSERVGLRASANRYGSGSTVDVMGEETLAQSGEPTDENPLDEEFEPSV